MTKRERTRRLKETRRYARRIAYGQAKPQPTAPAPPPPHIAKTDSGLYVVRDEVVRAL